MYYDEEFYEKAQLTKKETAFESKQLAWLQIAAEQLKNIANELHEANLLTVNSVPTHMTLDKTGATIHYGIEKYKENE